MARPVDPARLRRPPASLETEELAPAPPPASSPPPIDAAAIATLLDDAALDEAERAIALRISLHPADPQSWFLQARLLAARGQPDLAQAACRRALALWPDMLPVCDLLSSLAEQTGDGSDDVARARRMLLADSPGNARIANRLGAAYCADGRFAEALPYLRLAAPVLGHAEAALWNYSTSLALTGSHHELLSIEPMLIAFARDVPPPFGPFVHLAGAKLALRFDRPALLQESALRQGSGDWLDATRLAETIERAIAQARPFSLIMLSESHARLVVYASLQMQMFLSEAELSAVIDSVWTPAFGTLIESHGGVPVGAMARALLSAIEQSDVVEIPDADHLALAHEHFGFVAELQQIVLRRRSPLLAGLAVMSEIHRAAPFLRPLLSDLPFLGFVGSHPDLAERLGRFCQIEATATYLVPAALNRGDIAAHLRGAGHFPALFEQTLASLIVPYPGAVFLVAAGLLGPIYCGRIKQLGGIAIDIDSVVGRWLPS